MKSLCLIACCTLLMVSIRTVKAEDGETIQTLLNKEYTVVGVVQNPSGPGLFLQNKEQLFVCFISEASGSTVVKTRYCKPVQ